MTLRSDNQCLGFMFDPAQVDEHKLLENIKQRYNEIVEQYRLRDEEDVYNPWKIEGDGGFLGIRLRSTGVFCDDTILVPSLLIYLRIILEIGTASRYDGNGQLNYLYHDSVEDSSGVLTVSPGPVNSESYILLTRISSFFEIKRAKFTLQDLEDRDFVVGKLESSIINKRWEKVV